ncbi:MAG: transposase [Gemmatimonadales bacterium]
MLRRFLGYLEKIFDFQKKVGVLRDTRVGPQIPPSAVFQSVFLMFALRLGSFNRLEQELRRRGAWKKLLGGRPPSADTVGYSLCRYSRDEVRQLVADHHRQAWRNKAVKGRPGQRRHVVAIDGHELGYSEARRCPQCLERRIQKKDRTVTQYYHRVVVAQWIGVTPPGILDVELVGPGEGEVIAARRLLGRIVQAYGSLIDVISADAIYLEAPFAKDVLGAGKHFVVVLKQENRDLYQDAQQLRALRTPAVISGAGKTSRVWDLEGLTSFTTLGSPVRVVWAEEQKTFTRVVGGEKQEVTEDSTWVWVTDLSSQEASAQEIQTWGHDRWDLENRGFNELSQHWDMDHSFVHDPVAIEVLLLALALAFLTTYLFYERNLKEAAKRFLSRLALAARFQEDLPLVLALAPEPSG